MLSIILFNVLHVQIHTHLCMHITDTFVCLCVYMYVNWFYIALHACYVYRYVDMYIYIYVYIYIYIDTHRHTCIHAYMHGIYIYNMHIYVYIYICIYIYMCIYVYIYIYIFTHGNYAVLYGYLPPGLLLGAFRLAHLQSLRWPSRLSDGDPVFQGPVIDIPPAGWCSTQGNTAHIGDPQYLDACTWHCRSKWPHVRIREAVAVGHCTRHPGP